MIKTKMFGRNFAAKSFKNALLLIIAFCISLCSCDNNSSGNKETEAESKTYIASLSEYTLIAPENSSQDINRLCLRIREEIEAVTGITVTYTDDFVKGSDGSDVPGKEILVGNTARKESAMAVASLSEMDYRITVTSEKIVIAAGSDAALAEAVNSFIENIIRDENAMVPENYDLLYNFNKGDYQEMLKPVLSFDFNKIENNLTKSSDGKVEARIINGIIGGGHSGTAPRFQYAKPNGGALLPEGTVASLWKEKSAYSVSMWIMPYQSIDATIRYSLLAVNGTRGKTILKIEYSSPTVYVLIRDTGSSEAQQIAFTYNLDTLISPFNATHTNDGVWQLLTVTVDRRSDNVKLYINGNEITNKSGKVSFESATLPEQTDIVTNDYIGGSDGSRSFNGIIDDVMFFDRELSAAEVFALYHSYEESETPSPTEDQIFLNEMVEKLGSSFAIKAETSNVIHDGRVVKADVSNYAVNNTMIDGKLYLPADFCQRYFGTVDDNTLSVTDKEIKGKNKSNVFYFPAIDICNALGWSCIDQINENGMFLMLSDDADIDAKTDSVYILRMATFCEVDENEPKINVEQTRVVIAPSDKTKGEYTYSPSIVRCGSVLYASRDNMCLYTEIFCSEDDGTTWICKHRVYGLWWATIFECKGELYLIGRYTAGGIDASGPHYIGITKSTDGGVTWSEINSEIGGLTYESGFAVHCGPTPVLKHNGRIYRVFESTSGEKREFIISADENSDLLDPNSWTFSDYFTGFGFPNEGNAVEGPDGNVWILARYTASNAYLMRLTEDGKIVGYNGNNASSLIDFPNTANKVTCRYDEKTGKYIAITCPQFDENCFYQRNYCALCTSDDLIHWEIKEMLLCDREIYNSTLSQTQHGFQYIDWIIEGDDILFVVRESVEDAKNFHDSNYLTFYKIANYADLVK